MENGKGVWKMVRAYGVWPCVCSNSSLAQGGSKHAGGVVLGRGGPRAGLLAGVLAGVLAGM